MYNSSRDKAWKFQIYIIDKSPVLFPFEVRGVIKKFVDWCSEINTF